MNTRPTCECGNEGAWQGDIDQGRHFMCPDCWAKRERRIAIQRLRQARKLSPIDLDNSVGMQPERRSLCGKLTCPSTPPPTKPPPSRKEVPMVPAARAQLAPDQTTEREVHASPLAYT